jgi:hypothetical protein
LSSNQSISPVEDRIQHHNEDEHNVCAREFGGMA